MIITRRDSVNRELCRAAMMWYASQVRHGLREERLLDTL